jgi:uncharacterized protein YcfJ
MKKSLLAFAAAATALTGFASVPAAAHYGDHDGRYSRHYDDDYRYEQRDYRYEQRDYRRDYRNDRRDYRRDYRNDRRCDSGTGGTIIGAIAGGLAGREIVGRRGDRTTGAIIGGAVGALAGRAIDRSNSRC